MNFSHNLDKEKSFTILKKKENNKKCCDFLGTHLMTYATSAKKTSILQDTLQDLEGILQESYKKKSSLARFLKGCSI